MEARSRKATWIQVDGKWMKKTIGENPDIVHSEKQVNQSTVFTPAVSTQNDENLRSSRSRRGTCYIKPSDVQEILKVEAEKDAASVVTEKKENQKEEPCRSWRNRPRVKHVSRFPPQTLEESAKTTHPPVENEENKVEDVKETHASPASSTPAAKDDADNNNASSGQPVAQRRWRSLSNSNSIYGTQSTGLRSWKSLPIYRRAPITRPPQPSEESNAASNDKEEEENPSSSEESEDSESDDGSVIEGGGSSKEESEGDDNEWALEMEELRKKEKARLDAFQKEKESNGGLIRISQTKSLNSALRFLSLQRLVSPDSKPRQVSFSSLPVEVIPVEDAIVPQSDDEPTPPIGPAHSQSDRDCEEDQTREENEEVREGEVSER
eukprot:GCRY01004900.1.p1 GENE.GCRY01004900.1~~GCRY01004900.1.p1  ORF type:complete len:380 (-),score=44.00 GCRY01004900.1:606-1745(-)